MYAIIILSLLVYIDKIRREKKELHKWKAKRKKEERRKRKEELRRTEELANVCFNETCK